MAVIVSYLPAPTDVQAELLDGGSLLPNTTYYVVVTCKNFAGGVHYSAPVDGELVSEASEEISFTTTSTKLSAKITWTRPVGSTYYNVYMSKISGDYRDTIAGYRTDGGHRCGRIGNTVTDETRDTQYNVDNHTILLEGTLNTAYVNDVIGYGSLGVSIYDPQNPDKIMGLVPIGNGTINISYNTSTYTLKQICDALTAQGYGNYFYYNNLDYFILRGSINVPPTETSGSLKIIKHTLIFWNGTIQNRSAATTLQLGEYINGNTHSGCLIGTNIIKLVNTKAYNCIFNSKMIGAWYPYHIYQPERTTIMGISNETRDCFFYDYATAMYADLSNQYMFSKVYPLRTYITLSNNITLAWKNVYMEAYGFNPQWYGIFRDCTFKNTYINYFLSIPTIANRRIYFLDCTFIGDFSTTLETHKHYWNNAIGTTTSQIAAYYYSIILNVVDKEGNPIDGATVSMTDKNGNPAQKVEYIPYNTVHNPYSATTDASGNTAKADILSYEIRQNPAYGAGYQEYNQLRTDYSPFTLTVSKDGYEAYQSKLQLNNKIETRIALLSKINRNPMMAVNNRIMM